MESRNTQLQSDDDSVKLAARLYEERGHCLAALNEVSRAIDAFERAVNINPALIASWEMLEQLQRRAGDTKKASAAAAQVTMLRRLPPQIVAAGSLFCDGDLTSAESTVRLFLQTSGPHAEALRLLGRIAHKRNALGDAEHLLQEVLRLAPAYRAARADLVRVLIDSQRHPEAREQIIHLLESEPRNWDYVSLHATVCASLGDHERAIALYGEILAATPGWPDLHLLLGNSLKSVGRTEDAIASYRAAGAGRPNFGDAYWSLANLKTYRFTDEELDRMRAAEADRTTQLVDRYHLCFSLGKAMEDRADYAQSWEYYERGNSLKLRESKYDADLTQANIRRQVEFFSSTFLASHAGAGAPDPAPIFIVGLPRAGSTLVEQILASHSQVEGTRELPVIERIARDLQRGKINFDSPLDDLRELGDRYLRETRPYRRGRAGAPPPFFIDKMPNNFLHVGLIHLILPAAKIIDVRREPMACCFSNLKQLFARGQEFSYSVEGVAHYYRSYISLMKHWDDVLPGRVLRVSYEALVHDVESGVRRILQFCGLEFEERCIEFHKTERTVNTASSEQVRQPIYRDGLAQWRYYEPWLGSLQEALGEVTSDENKP